MYKPETMTDLSRLAATLPFSSHVTLSKAAFDDMCMHANLGGAYGGPAKAYYSQEVKA